MSFTNLVESAAAASDWTQQQQMEEAKPAPEGRGLWSPEEHRLFVDGIKLFPSGPWKDIANHVGTRTARQTMTHAQKYRQKIARRLRNVRMSGKHNLPFLMDRFNALLSSDEQFNDSILATSLAIAAEQELDMLGEAGDGSASPVQVQMNMQMQMQMQMGMMSPGAQPNVAMEPMGPGNTYQKQLPLAIDFSSTEGNPYYLDAPSFEPSDIEFDKCMDFLIETFHREN
ncbi:unnamed protein product [Phytophthora fragariaefolia]|uniref:Unnamed protein product n=1 Tax=Phytophthora fragariaefolia TaxID=1490495 RepID=A0A9W6X736_9STRA|nr:unnamed protein product [Phytophthora fragariaefolia]